MIDTPDAARLDYANYHHGDPLDGQHCEPEMPKDAPLDIFRDALKFTGKPASIQAVGNAAESWALAVFEEFMREWRGQENEAQAVRGEQEAAIAMLHFCTNNPSKEIRLRAKCILLILGRSKKSEVDIAREEGCTRANVSAKVKQIQRHYVLRKARGMRSEAAVEVYRARATRVHKQRKQQEKTQWKNNSFNRLSTLKSALMQTLAPES